MPSPRLAKVAFSPFLASSSTSVLRCSAPTPRTSRRTWSSTPSTSSHIGSAPIPLPPAVTFVSPSPHLGSSTSPSQAFIRGPKGQLGVPVAPFVRLAVGDAPASASATRSTLEVAVEDASLKHQRAVWGLTRSLLANAVTGVSEGFTLPLRLVGVGYRASVEASSASATQSDSPPVQRLNLKLGFAHPVLIDLPSDVTAITPTPTSIVLAGIDKQRLGQVAARIRSWRVPEPYNGKGIFVGDEQVRRKEVKKK
ncbi:hypothetical protein JCM11641_003511 [Rhodosporidiobolus odoratus]